MKKYSIINNDEDHTGKIEDGVSSLQLLSCYNEADSRIALHTSKSRANVVVVLKDRHFEAWLVILRAQYQKNVLKYDKNIYVDIETIWKYLGTLPVEIYCNAMHL